MNFRAWIKALRLRTLPLALSGIFAGNALAYYYGRFDPMLFKLSIYTALLLQILSNLANDYGDFKKGTDNDRRIGPERAMQSGDIKESEMKTAMMLTGFGALIAGLWLVYEGTKDLDLSSGIFFLLLGIVSIVAAVTYTVGKNAYGYKGLGDLLVFIFFGIVAVAGSFYLQFKILLPEVLLPAAALGFFSAGVLNMNNMRDVENDKASGKITIPVRIGDRYAKLYHFFLVAAGVVAALIFQVMFLPATKIYHLAFIMIFIIHAATVARIKLHRRYDSQLKVVVLGTLLYAVLLCSALVF